MNRDEVIRLTRKLEEVAVSILLPVERAAPFHDRETLRVKQLVDEACGRLQRSYPIADSGLVVKRLHDVIEHLDFGHPDCGYLGGGLAIFVSADEEHVIPLPFPVDQQLSIETTFATRQLLVGFAHLIAIRVLVLSEHLVRLFENIEGQLVEVHKAGFPMVARFSPSANTPHADLPIHEGVKAEEHRVVYRAVDAALDAAAPHSGAPLIVLGATREIAYFDEVSHHGRLVTGRVCGSYARADVGDIERLVRPVIEAHASEQQDQAVHDVRERVGRRQVVVGFEAVYPAAVAGRGHRLVIEENFGYPIHLTDGGAAGNGSGVPWDLDAAVDELIERVMVAGGDVVFVGSGKLASERGVALELRY